MRNCYGIYKKSFINVNTKISKHKKYSEHNVYKVFLFSYSLKYKKAMTISNVIVKTAITLNKNSSMSAPPHSHCKENKRR
ncbi:hypothetical protein D8Y14_01150 [Listeria innocua]|nr:hypothetical protein [Listeria innocua]MBM5670068.1 hypothetical protein [Listeria innocua]MBM5672949.1 hypothetical protein [Listeria innocua]MBM5710851.1 hypothetical protein [Listeria innocua]